MGDTWVHFRLCLTCGHVSCCDDWKNKHATKHFHATRHPIIQSFEPGEDWGWCYVDHRGPLHRRYGECKTKEAQECREETHGYFARNAERMRYRTFLEAGYQIGSGVMEAACKTVVHQRLDQSGLHWRPETADAVVALRANQLSHSPRDLLTYCVGGSAK